MELRLELGADWTASGTTFRHVNRPLRIEVRTDDDWGAIEEREGRSATGWRVRIAERRVRVPSGDEQQLRLRYEIFEWIADVIVAGPPDAIAAHRDELEAAALSGRPDWSHEPACLGQLLADVDA